MRFVAQPDTCKPPYVLFVAAGYYEATTILGLLIEIVKHRTWHLLRGDGWKD